MGAERVMNFEIDGLKIEYDLYGEGGRLIVILHGWGCAKEIFRPAAERLAKNGYTVAVPDLCGFGQSAEPPRPFSVGDYAAVFTKFIESFGARPVSLIGHSFGGRIIFKLYEQTRPPFLVERVMLIDAAGIRPKKTVCQRISLLGYKIGRRFLSLPPLARRRPWLCFLRRRGRTPRLLLGLRRIFYRCVLSCISLQICLQSVVWPGFPGNVEIPKQNAASTGKLCFLRDCLFYKLYAFSLILSIGGPRVFDS